MASPSAVDVARVRLPPKASLRCRIIASNQAPGLTATYRKQIREFVALLCDYAFQLAGQALIWLAHVDADLLRQQVNVWCIMLFEGTAKSMDITPGMCMCVKFGMGLNDSTSLVPPVVGNGKDKLLAPQQTTCLFHAQLSSPSSSKHRHVFRQLHSVDLRSSSLAAGQLLLLGLNFLLAC